MPIFPIIIIASIIMYVYFKVMIIRSNDPLIQEITNAKARMSLGIFMIAFGVNQYVYYQTQIALFVTIAFLLIGFIQLIAGWKRYKHYTNEQKKRKTATV
ncbi:YtpI family protein [Gracilibacillus marinus]|jgi:hypothetical protein|uniref:YtpI family protein n=1 Tax=Gracilibacillus marinus TaxID=630535 RepID=A0ABV8VUS3_9BACI